MIMRRKLTISVTAAAMMIIAANPVLANWEQENGTWSYKDNGQTVANTWKQIDKKWYYFDKAGEMQSGWLEQGGRWYYLDPNNGDMKEGWVQDGKKWYYLDHATGEMQSGWLEKDKKWYYLDPNNGDMKEGWIQDGKDWYYLNNATGEMATGWTNTGKDWYFLDNQGCMQTGIVEVNGKIYALDQTTGAMQTGTVVWKDKTVSTFDPVTGEATGDIIPTPTKAYRSDGKQQEDFSVAVKEQIRKTEEKQKEKDRVKYDSPESSDESSSKEDNSNNSSNNILTNVKIREITAPKSGMVDVVLSEAVALDSSNFYISCPAGKDMTILKVETENGSQKNKVYHITTTHYNNNTYNMEIMLPNKRKIEKKFITSLSAPEIKEIEAKRTDKNTAAISLISDSAGMLYYMAVPIEASKQVLFRQVIMGEVPQTGREVQEKGTSLQMNQQGIYNLTIKDLKENQEYIVYFATAQADGEEPVLRGSVSVSAQPEGGNSGENVGEIKIEEADAVSNDKIKFVLNKPIQETLTLENIDVTCVNGEIHIGGIQTEDNKTYYIPMQSNWFMNSKTSYTVYVTLSDGKRLEKKFYADFDYPNINGGEVKRIAEDEIEVTFRSDEGGVFYYGTTKNPEIEELPTADEIVQNGLRANLSGGSNRLRVKIEKDDKLFYFVPVDQKGNRPPRFAERMNIPNKVEVEPEVKPEKETEIESIVCSNGSIGGFHRLTVTVKKEIDPLAIEKETIKIYSLDNQSLPSYRIVERGETYDGPNIFFIRYNIQFPSGRYELEFKYNGVTYSKQFEIK